MLDTGPNRSPAVPRMITQLPRRSSAWRTRAAGVSRRISRKPNTWTNQRTASSTSGYVRYGTIVGYPRAGSYICPPPPEIPPPPHNAGYGRTSRRGRSAPRYEEVGADRWGGVVGVVEPPGREDDPARSVGVAA